MFPPPGAIGCSRGLHANDSNIKDSAGGRGLRERLILSNRRAREDAFTRQGLAANQAYVCPVAIRNSVTYGR